MKKMKQKRAKLENALLSKFGKDKIDGCKGATAIASIRKARFPSIKDMRKFHQYILKHKALDLLQNRVASKAYFARLEEGENVPGINIFERVSVSIRGRKA